MFKLAITYLTDAKVRLAIGIISMIAKYISTLGKPDNGTQAKLLDQLVNKVYPLLPDKVAETATEADVREVVHTGKAFALAVIALFK